MLTVLQIDFNRAVCFHNRKSSLAKDHCQRLAVLQGKHAFYR